MCKPMPLKIEWIILAFLAKEVVVIPTLLPTSSDYCSLKKNFTILVSRVIVENLTFFREDFKGLVLKHIPHKYSTEQSKKS